MGAIHETLTLEDKFSASFTRFIQLGERAAGASSLASNAARNYQAVANQLDRRLIALNAQFAAMMQEQERMAAAGKQNTQAFSTLDAQMERLGATIRSTQTQYDLVTKEMQEAQRAANAASRSQNRYNQSMKEGKTAASGLGSTLRSLAATYLSFQSVKGLFGLSDELAQTEARLDLVNEKFHETLNLQELIYQSAQRTGSAYTDTAAAVAKLALNAGSAFSSGREVVAFMEQVNKHFLIGGASVSEQMAAVQQLTQAMGAGVLRGEELNSILYAAPSIARAIEQSMGWAEGSIKQYAEQGLVSAGVVKNALFSVAEETDERFSKLPLTWARVWNMASNLALKALDPILDGINYLANHVDDALQWVSDNMDLVVAALAGIAAAAAVAGAQMAASAIASALAWAAANWPLLLVAASIGAVIFAARKMGATWEEIGGVVGTVLGHMYANVMNVFLVPAQRQFAAFANFVGNFLKNPVGAVIVLFQDMALTVLGYIKTVAHGMEDLINKIPIFQVDLTSGIDAVYKQVEDAAQKNKDAMGWEEFVRPWGYVDYTDAWNQGAEIGKGLGSKLDSFNMQEFISQLSGAFTDGMNWDEFLDQVEGIGDSVSGIEKSVDLSDEDLKSLVDVAERRYVNRVNLTAQTPVITVNGANTGRTAADRQSLANAIRDILLEERASGAVRSTAAPVVG